MTDLTSERLDELQNLVDHSWSWQQFAPIPLDDQAALIAMAKRTEAAERERDDLRDERDRLRGLCDWLQEQVFDYQRQLIHCPASAHDDWIVAALAQPTDAGGA